MNVLIIEDEYPAAERLEKLLHRIDARINVVAMLQSVASAKQWFGEGHAVDLIFADIQLSDGLSFQIFDTFPAHSPIVFTTSYDEYAIRAFRVKSIDYLLKPIKLPDLTAAIGKYHALRQTFSPQAHADRIDSLLDAMGLGARGRKSRFLVRQGEQLIPVAQEEVAYFYTANELACLVTRDGRQFLVDHTLEALESLVNPVLFFRLNRQFIAHVEAIDKIHPYFNGKLKIELRPAPGQEVLVSREKSAGFKTWLAG